MYSNTPPGADFDDQSVYKPRKGGCRERRLSVRNWVWSKINPSGFTQLRFCWKS